MSSTVEKAACVSQTTYFDFFCKLSEQMHWNNKCGKTNCICATKPNKCTKLHVNVLKLDKCAAKYCKYVIKLDKWLPDIENALHEATNALKGITNVLHCKNHENERQKIESEAWAP